MRILSCLLLSCALAVGTLAAEVAPTGTQYKIDTKIVSVPAAMASNHFALTADSMTVQSNGTWNVGGSAKAIGDWVADLARRKDVDVLSAPSVTTLDGQEATIQVMQALSYMVPTSNGLYRTEVLDGKRAPGIHLTLRCTTIDQDSVRTEVEFIYNLLIRMTRLPDTTLQVGAPEMDSRNLKTTLSTRLGDWLLIGGSQRVQREADDEQENIIVLLRVTKVE